MPEATLTNEHAVWGNSAPPLFEDLYSTLPPVLKVIHLWLQHLYSLPPRAFVREEKNKASNFHSTVSNLTVYLERNTLPEDYRELALFENMAENTFVLDLPEWALPVILTSLGRTSLFISKIETVAPGTPKSWPISPTEAGLAHYQVVRASRPLFETLNSEHEARYLAICTRIMELSVTSAVEYYMNDVDPKVHAFNTGATQRAWYHYIELLTQILCAYLRPVPAE